MRLSLLLTSIALACIVAPSHQQNLRSLVTQDTRDVLDYWTPERIKEALLKSDDWQNQTQRRLADENPPLTRVQNADFPHNPPEAGGATATAEQSAVQRAVGVLLFNTAFEEPRACTASVIDDGGKDDRSLLLTAAHCLCDSRTRSWNKDFVFVPMQDDKQRDTPREDLNGDRRRSEVNCTNDPYGCFIPTIAVIDKEWVKKKPQTLPAMAKDYGILVVPNGQREVKFHGRDGLPHEKLDNVKSPMFGDIVPLVLNKPGPNASEVNAIHLGYPSQDERLRGQAALRYAAQNAVKLPVDRRDPNNEHFVWVHTLNMLREASSGGPFIENPVVANGKVFSVASAFLRRPLVVGGRRVQVAMYGPFLDTMRFMCVLETAQKIPLTSNNTVSNVQKVAEDKDKVCTHEDMKPEIPRQGNRVVGPGERKKRTPTPKVKTDPHFETWSGKHFEYMGGCDLVLLTAPNFGPDLSLDIHIRTKVRDFYSFVERAAVKIGSEVLEVGSYGEYFLNGVDNATMPNLLSGFAVTLHQPFEKVIMLEINLGFGQTIQLKTFTVKDFVAVEIHTGDGNNTRFNGSLGMMGDYETGRLTARDGVTLMGEQGTNAFGAEWQVRDDEEMFFQTTEHPQYPEQCVLPDPAAVEAVRRRLGIAVSHEEAEIACGHLGDDDKEDCIYDVMATGDLEMAEYAY